MKWVEVYAPSRDRNSKKELIKTLRIRKYKEHKIEPCRESVFPFITSSKAKVKLNFSLCRIWMGMEE
jgi:hypothetical protein